MLHISRAIADGGVVSQTAVSAIVSRLDVFTFSTESAFAKNLFIGARKHPEGGSEMFTIR